MENLILDTLDDNQIMIQSISCEIGPEGIIFPKADLKFSRDGLTKISTGDHYDLINIQPEDIKLGRIIGNGQSGCIQIGIHKHTDFPIAIKTVSIFDKQKRQQVMNEFKTFLNTAVFCENLVQFYGAYYEEGSIKLVLELMNMGSLRDILNICKIVKSQEPIIDDAILKKITYQILQGIHFLHNSTHHVHRDVKPENILVNSYGKVKLTDFGISKELDKTLSYCKTFIGTMIYMSPERMQGLNYNYSSDLWSLGLVLYELSTGKYPYSLNQSYIEIIQNIITSPEPYIPNYSCYSFEFQDFVKKCLNKDLNQRATAQELLRHPWLADIDSNNCDISQWINNLCFQYNQNNSCTKKNTSTIY